MMILAGGLTFLHDRATRGAWRGVSDDAFAATVLPDVSLQAYRERPAGAMAAAAAACTDGCRQGWATVERRLSWVTRNVLHTVANQPYLTFVEGPSILLPLVVELGRPFLQLSTWTFWVAFTEMVLSMRLVHEGTLIAQPLERLVSVIDAATPNMLALVVVLAPLSMLTSLMHSQVSQTPPPCQPNHCAVYGLPLDDSPIAHSHALAALWPLR